jgi:hypothetical protein
MAHGRMPRRSGSVINGGDIMSTVSIKRTLLDKKRVNYEKTPTTPILDRPLRGSLIQIILKKWTAALRGLLS